MNHVLPAILASTSLLAVASTAAAQPADTQSADPAAQAEAINEANEEAGSGEIVITARRRTESLQDVPQSVGVVTGETVEELLLTDIRDIQQVVPGLTISNEGFFAGTTMRGISNNLAQNAPPTVQYYLNDAPFNVPVLFDIGQIEVLRGPQGTLRGRSAPTGAITITTRRADLSEVGGYVNMFGTNRGGIHVEGAVGAPIIHDVLGLRLAGYVDHDEGNGIRSINNMLDPYRRREAFRASLLFEPVSNLSIRLMYQHVHDRGRAFEQVSGNGSPGFALPPAGPAGDLLPGFNGPPISPRDRRGVTDAPRNNKQVDDYIIGEADWTFGGQKLSYVGAWRRGEGDTRTPLDTGNFIPNFEYFQEVATRSGETTHELRLASDDRIADIFDYTAGIFYDRTWGKSNVDRLGAFLSGAFGAPGTTPVIGPPNFRYSLPTTVALDNVEKELSFFGSVTAHLGERTELTLGGRYLIAKTDSNFSLNLGSGFFGINAPFPTFLCPTFIPGSVASPVYPRACDLLLAPSVLQGEHNIQKHKKFLYNASLSHNFNDDLMIYAQAGSSFRRGPVIIGFSSALSFPAFPQFGSLRDLIFLPPETSRAIEIGLKASFFEKRGHFNIALYRQKFKNFPFYAEPVQYLNVSGTNPTADASASLGRQNFTVASPAIVTGVDIDASLKVTDLWNVAVGFSWAKGKLDNATIPCDPQDLDGDGVIDVDDFQVPGQERLVFRCSGRNDRIARVPKWNFTAQSEYGFPLTDNMEGFVRGNFVYYPGYNSARTFKVGSRHSLDLYAGIRSPDGAWEVAVFAKNATNNFETLEGSTPVESAGLTNIFGPSGYFQTRVTPRRQLGLNVRYAFGSR